MSLTVLLIIVTVSLSFYAFKYTEIKNKFLFYPYLIYRRKQFYRFITSGFIHEDINHLLFNMFAFYSFGESLEVTYAYYFGEKGKLWFMVLYIGGLIFSQIPSFFKNKNNYEYCSLGSSGAVDSIIFSCILFNPTSPICLFFVFCLPGFIFGFLYIIYTLYMAKNDFYSRINHWSHLYGAIFGVIFNIILEPKIIFYFIFQIKRALLYISF